MEITSVKRIHQSDWTDSGVRFLRARDIVAVSKNEEVSEPLFISQEKYDEYSALSGKVKIGDLLVTGVGTIGVPMLINSEEPLYFKDGNIIWFKNENRIDGRFFYYSFNGSFIQNFITESSGIGTVGTYTIENGKKTPINLPVQKEEQEKIGEYFSKLDSLITLHQRKYIRTILNCETLMMNDFTFYWEQRELRTAATFSKGSGYSKNDLKENGTPIILYGRLYTKYETVINEVDTFVDVQPNSVYSTGREVIVPASGETAEDISRASFVAKSGILLGGDLNIITPAEYINPVFLALTISNGNQQKELSKRAQGKSVVHIHNSDLENVVLLYPSYDEQKKIGAYFSKIDNLITLHQRERGNIEEKQRT